MSEGTKYRFRFTATYEVDVDAENYPDDLDPYEEALFHAEAILVRGILDDEVDVEVEWLESD